MKFELARVYCIIFSWLIYDDYNDVYLEKEIRKKVKELNKDLGLINSLIEGNRLKTGSRRRLENKYKTKQRN